MYIWHRWPLFFRGRLALLYELTGERPLVIRQADPTRFTSAVPIQPGREGRWDRVDALLERRTADIATSRRSVAEVLDAWFAGRSLVRRVIYRNENEYELEAEGYAFPRAVDRTTSEDVTIAPVAGSPA